MLTIGQLASYAGVTTRAVRHYHHVGLLPEPERDASGYRTYAAPHVVRLIRIRTLAEAGVPLSRVEQLLAADEAAFAAEVQEIDRRLRREVRELQEHRRRIAHLVSGERLVLPAAVTDYLDEMRDLGASEIFVEVERDAWILIAARWPDRIDDYMVEKRAQLRDPLMRRVLTTMGGLLDGVDAGTGDLEPQLVEVADLLAEMLQQASDSGAIAQEDFPEFEGQFVALVESVALSGGPRMVALQARLQELLVERGWSSLVRNERV